MLNPDFGEFVESLNDNLVRYLVVGGYAVALHGHPRYTKDLDIWIEMTPENAERMVQALEQFGFGSLGLQAADFLVPDQIVQLAWGFPPGASVCSVRWQAWNSRIATHRGFKPQSTRLRSALLIWTISEGTNGRPAACKIWQTWRTWSSCQAGPRPVGKGHASRCLGLPGSEGEVRRSRLHRVITPVDGWPAHSWEVGLANCASRTARAALDPHLNTTGRKMRCGASTVITGPPSRLVLSLRSMFSSQ